MAKFTSLTQYIPAFRRGGFGEWTLDQENNGSQGHPIQLPYVDYVESVSDFIKDVVQFMIGHPEFDLGNYREILAANNLELRVDQLREIDPSSLDEEVILALITGAVREDRFNEGSLLAYFDSGSMVKWLERLEAIDAAKE